jgi:hypothetical protein
LGKDTSSSSDFVADVDNAWKKNQRYDVSVATELTGSNVHVLAANMPEKLRR